MFWKDVAFWTEAFFSKRSKKFSVDFKDFSGYLKGPSDLDLFPVEEIVTASHDTSIKLYARKSEKSWNFEKMKPKMKLEYSDKTLCFELSCNFFSTSQNLEFQTSDGDIKKIDRSIKSS